MNPRRRLIILITGFLKPHAFGGLVKLAAMLTALVAPDTEVRLYRWRDHDLIVQETTAYAPTDVVIIGHSYGVGTGAAVCKSMPTLNVTDFVGTDGIWRPDVYKPSFKSLKDGHKLVMPGNVDTLHTFRQSQGMLRGHDYDIQPTTTWATDIRVRGPPHARMDRIPQLIKLAIKLATEEQNDKP